MFQRPPIQGGRDTGKLPLVGAAPTRRRPRVRGVSRVEGSGVIAPRRSNIAHHRRSWPARWLHKTLFSFILCAWLRSYPQIGQPSNSASGFHEKESEPQHSQRGLRRSLPVFMWAASICEVLAAAFFIWLQIQTETLPKTRSKIPRLVARYMASAGPIFSGEHIFGPGRACLHEQSTSNHSPFTNHSKVDPADQFRTEHLGGPDGGHRLSQRTDVRSERHDSAQHHGYRSDGGDLIGSE
jgi:hypothetical protein